MTRSHWCCGVRVTACCLLLAAIALPQTAMAQGDASGPSKEKRPPCICTREYLPVCGITLKGLQTFGNQCTAACENATIAYKAACKPEPCSCPNISFPVCGTDGVTYLNECFLKCAGAKKKTHGICPAECICTLQYDPVCGVDGKTWGNACGARCAGIPVAFTGECSSRPRPCKCTTTFKPVCGSDKQSYPNECIAVCSSVTSFTKGACGSSPAPTPSPKPSPSPKPPKVDVVAACGESLAAVQFPVCVLKKGASKTVQYKNPCVAEANGVNLAAGDRYFYGKCKPSCDIKCGAKAAADKGKPVCCSKNATSVSEHISYCYATCVAGIKSSSCSSGQCKGKRAESLFTNAPCRPGSPLALCVRNFGCASTKTCPAHPRATCLDNAACYKFVRLKEVKVCSANFLTSQGDLYTPKECGSSDSGPDLPPTPPSPRPTNQCAAVGGQCTLDPLPLPPQNQPPKIPCCGKAVCQGAPGRVGQIYGVCTESR